MTITLTETDIAAYRARVERFEIAVQLWFQAHSPAVSKILSASDSDMDQRLEHYKHHNFYPVLRLFDL